MSEDVRRNLFAFLREVREIRREMGEDVPEPPEWTPAPTSPTTLWGRPAYLVDGIECGLAQDDDA